MSATYGGDEVGALVLDIGTSWTKAGYAGEDMPDAYLPTNLGYYPPDDNSMDTDSSTAGKWLAGDQASNVCRTNMEIKSPLTDGIVSDWDAFEHLLTHTLKHHLRVNPSDHPLLMTEPAWNPKVVRERLTELAFEAYDFPAFFLAKNPVLAAFAAGKGSALVVECGGGTTSVVPVYEGYVLNKAISHQAIAGDFLTYQTLLTFNWNKVDIVPSYLMASKEPVEMGAPAKVSRRNRPGTTDSFHRNALLRTFDDFKQAVAAVSETTLNEQISQQLALTDPTLTKGYEFACGYNNQFTLERLRIAEVLFQPSKYVISPSTMPEYPYVWPNGINSADDVKSIPAMLRKSLDQIDVDVRPGLLTNVVCTGGSAQMPGFSTRIENEITGIVPGGKVKITAGSTSSLPERKFGAWLGASILGSIGTFHSLWIAKKEYEEHGRNIVERKCV